MGQDFGDHQAFEYTLFLFLIPEGFEICQVGQKILGVKNGAQPAIQRLFDNIKLMIHSVCFVIKEEKL